VKKHCRNWSIKRERQQRSTTTRHASNRYYNGTSPWRSTPTCGRLATTSNQTVSPDDQRSRFYKRLTGERRRTTRSRPSSCSLLVFPTLPENMKDEGGRPQRQPVPMPEIIEEEIERCLIKTKPWKAAGEEQIWPGVSESVRQHFQTSLDTPNLPLRWKIARIIPLEKPDKDHTLAKVWRLILLLSTLGKLLKAVIAERLSFAVKIYDLRPTTSARKRENLRSRRRCPQGASLSRYDKRRKRQILRSRWTISGPQIF
jgi:hypothetical protein